MISMMRVVRKSFVLAAALAACMQAAPAAAQLRAVYISSTGNDANTISDCSAANPCASFVQALALLGNGGELICLDNPGVARSGGIVPQMTVTIDCPGTIVPPAGRAFDLRPDTQAVKIRHLTFNGSGGATGAIGTPGSGTLVIEDCVFENFGTVAPLTIQPTGALNLVIRNSRFFNNGAGIIIKPLAGGSVTATFDHVTITQNGGGIHTDSSNGPVTVDVYDSVSSDNDSNGFNVTSGTGTQNNVMTIARTVISNNGLTGIQAGGSNAAVLVDTTVLDGNTNGATQTGAGGRILSYGNNRIVGSPGSGFSGGATQR